MPVFARKDVVSAARGQGVHGLQANARGHQAALQGRAGKAQPGAAAKDDQLGLDLSELVKQLGAELIEANARPVQALAVRANDDAVGDFFQLRHAIDDGAYRYPARSVGIDDLRVGFIGL